MFLSLSPSVQLLATIAGYLVTIGVVILVVGFAIGLIYWIIQAIKYPTAKKYYEKFGKMPENIFIHRYE